jgi:hypothetical protein
MTTLAPARPIRLLILSIGSLAAQNIMQALAGRRQHAFVIGANSIADAAGNFTADVTYLVPPAGAGDAYPRAIERLIANERPDLVIPARDDDILVLARMRERMGPQPTLLVGSTAAAEIMNDKMLTAAFADRHRLPFAPTVDTLQDARGLADIHGFPLIGKPRCGNGARGVVILRSEAELEQAFELRPDLVVQPFLDLPPDGAALMAPFAAGLPFFFSFPERSQYTTQMLIAPDGVGSEIFACRNVQIGGQAVRNQRVDDRGLIDIGARYGEAISKEGWVGPVNIQAKRTADGEFVPFEMNGRFGGGTAARTQMGFDEVGTAIRSFLPGTDFPLLAGEVADVVQKTLTSFALPRGPANELKQAGHWRRSTPA